MAENAATQSAADMRKLAEASNPLLVVQNPIVVNASLGVLAAYLARKWAYGNFRDQFGWASKGPDGRIHYYGAKKDSSGNPDTSKEVQSAYRCTRAKARVRIETHSSTTMSLLARRPGIVAAVVAGCGG